MFKKGQAAMEFLMTYGWAILVVLAAIGALAYFGVLSPQNLLPERTTFAAPLSNVDTAYISGTTIAVTIANNVGYDINITGVAKGTGDAGTTEINCGAVTPTGTVKNNDKVTLTFTGCGAMTKGDRVKGDLSFEYLNLYTSQLRNQTGSVNGKVN